MYNTGQFDLYFSYFISHYQFGKTNQYEKAKIELMGYLCADLAFDFLRTKSTLGYLCFSKVIKVSDYYGFRHGSRNNKSILQPKVAYKQLKLPVWQTFSSKVQDCWTWNPIWSINIGAQRDRFSAEEVYSKVLEFNDLFIEHLRTMPQNRFDNYRRSYAIELKKVPQEGFQTVVTT